MRKHLWVIVAISGTIHLSKTKTWQSESPDVAGQANSMESVELSCPFQQGEKHIK